MIVKVNEKEREKRKGSIWSTVDLLDGKNYTVLRTEYMANNPSWPYYAIVDESGEDYLYPASLFDIVEE
ncbi:MAG: hypothetical protein IJY24_00065 [Clostridia bacterium]|nr:hypothetical protein [Clostridia bacterium]